jgi:hypothetical protein
LATKELAGKETKFTFGFTLTISLIGVAAVLKVIFAQIKIVQQARELERLRKRCDSLEQERRTPRE